VVLRIVKTGSSKRLDRESAATEIGLTVCGGECAYHAQIQSRGRFGELKSQVRFTSRNSRSSHLNVQPFHENQRTSIPLFPPCTLRKFLFPWAILFRSCTEDKECSCAVLLWLHGVTNREPTGAPPAPKDSLSRRMDKSLTN
jgi:hypothetical protein